MITLAETYQRERQAGEREGRRLGEQEGRRTGEREGRRLGEQEGRRTGEREGRRLGEQEGRRLGEQEGRRLGEQEGRQQTLSEYVRLFWDEATSQAFHQRLSALDTAHWPSLRALHAAYQEGRDPLPALGSRNELALKPKDDAAPATT